MSRPFHLSAGFSALFAVAACSPTNLATAPDTHSAVNIVPTADPSLPPPAEQALSPICQVASPELVAQLQQQINAERERLGRTPVAFVDNLAFAAQAHACDMAAMGRMTVAGSNGSSVVHRVRAVEYTACASAQLIGRAGDAYAQYADWMAEPAEEEIAMHQQFDDAGIGVTQSGGRLWWSLVLADDCSGGR